MTENLLILVKEFENSGSHKDQIFQIFLELQESPLSKSSSRINKLFNDTGNKLNNKSPNKSSDSFHNNYVPKVINQNCKL